MASNGSIATTLAPTRETLSSSQLLSSSISSLSNPGSSSRHASSQISKIYRQASTLFLTRRLPESLSTILPVITPPPAESEDTVGPSGSATEEGAPIAKASRTTRIKVWSLYLTILNAVLELDPEEGKVAFGSSEYRALVSKVREGSVWEEVVRNGYLGVEGDVDSDVVINLATLLLAHAKTQKTNQTRLENYLAASSSPNLDISARLQSESRNGSRSPIKSSGAGTDTPRDLNARVKILELYTLHVLLRNNEWDYAREFISISEVLDEERREAFLQALQSLQDEQQEVERREREERRYQEDLLRKEVEEQRRKREQEEREREEGKRKEGSETDYGVEDTPSVSSSRARSTKAPSANGAPTSSSKPKSSPTTRKPQPPAAARKRTPDPNLLTRAVNVVGNLRKMMENLAGALGQNPMVILRLLTFIIALVVIFGRRDVRETVRRMWEKVKRTAGMGVKVSYI